MKSNIFAGELWTLNESEKSIVKDEIRKFRSLLKWGLIMLLFFGIVLPFLLFFFLDFATHPEEYYKENDLPVPEILSIQMTIVICLIMIGIIGGLIGAFVYKPLRNLRYDIKKNQKIRVPSTITKKQFVPISQSYFLYTYNKQVMTIEVDSQIFNSLEKGDTIYLFYTPKSAIYLGYTLKY